MYSWNIHPSGQRLKSSTHSPQSLEIEITTRRRIFLKSIAAAELFPSFVPITAAAYTDEASKNGIVTVRLESPKDSLGVEIFDSTLRGETIVVLRRIVTSNSNNRLLKEGMILRPRDGGSLTSRELVERLRSGPYPLEVDFVNLAARGDALSDVGTSIVTPKDALELAQKTEGAIKEDKNNVKPTYSITAMRQTTKPCAIQSRRNDVIEITYEAAYVESGTGRKVVYDASAFRGTGNRPYQMVLGSGDMIPGVDQGLYDMCPGDERLLKIPPMLGHGPNSRKLFRIPDNYQYLEWKVGLVTIDSTIKEDNNVVSRDDRESRFAYE